MGKSSFCSKEAYSAEMKKHMYLSKENHLCWYMQHLAHYASVRIEGVFEKNTSCKTEFSKWRKAHFLPHWSISCADETHVFSREPIDFRSMITWHIVSL
jgi:hypothetical protein